MKKSIWNISSLGLEKNDIIVTGTSKEEKEFITFIEAYAKNKFRINKEEKDGFKSKFTRLYNLAFCHKDPNNRIYDKDKMNKLLEKQNIAYKVEAEREKKPPRATYWVVVNFNQRADKSKVK